MAAINQYVHFRDTPRPDGLCPQCHNPALKLYRLQRLDLTGITPIGTRLGCADCKGWVEPLKELTK